MVDDLTTNEQDEPKEENTAGGTEPTPEEQIPEEEVAKPQSNVKKWIIGTIGALVVAAGVVAYWMMQQPQAPLQTGQEPVQQQSVAYKSYWAYTNSQEHKAYLYDPAANKSELYLTLTDKERIQVSPDGKHIAKMRDNIVEVATAATKPEFKQVYADADKAMAVDVSWLPDSSKLVLNAHKLTETGAGNVPKFLHTVSTVKPDGTDLKKLFDYPTVYAAITIEGANIARGELYYSEAGEGGLNIALGVYRLSDGTKQKTYQGSDNPLAVAGGKAYKVKDVTDSTANTQKAQIIEINLDDSKEAVVYETKTVKQNSFTRTGSSSTFVEGIAIRSLKASADGKSLYFNEIHNLKTTETKLKALTLADHKAQDVYTPTMTGSYITVTTLAADKTVIGNVNCGGCTSAEYNTLGNEYVYIDPTNLTWQRILQTKATDLGTFQPLLLPE